MKPSIRRIRLEFDLSDKNVADVIANSIPPDGVTTSKPSPLVKAAADSGGIFYQVVLYFSGAASAVILNMLAAWLYDCCKKSGKKKGRVNGHQIVYSKYSISLVIKKELESERKRDTQGRKDKNRTSKKCP
jgi:hypothetical protein